MRMYKRRLNIKESVSKFYNLVIIWKIGRNINQLEVEKKKAVSEAKSKALERFYQTLETKNGE